MVSLHIQCQLWMAPYHTPVLTGHQGQSIRRRTFPSPPKVAAAKKEAYCRRDMLLCPIYPRKVPRYRDTRVVNFPYETSTATETLWRCHMYAI